MNLNPLGVMALLGGVVLLYAAVTNKYPQDVIRIALGKDAIHGPIYTSPDSLPGAEAHKLVPKAAGDTGPGSGVPVVTV